MSPEVLTFGEVMLRFTTPDFQRFAQAQSFRATFGGAEANVAVTIAALGGSAGYATRLPENDLAEGALAELRGLDVDISRVMRGGERLGTYFLEQGMSQRGGKIIYDRAHSSMATARPEDFAWDELLEGVRWFHWSGITPALSPQAPEIVAQACAAARRRGLTVSFDLNYRAKLWSTARAGEVLAPLMEHVDLCITSAEEACEVFGIAVQSAGQANREEEVAAQLCERFGFRQVALTKRTAQVAESTEWAAMLYAGGAGYHSRRHHVSIVDRLGAGDSFSGALIFALRRGDDPASAVEFAVAASTLKHTIPGDYFRITLEEVEALVAGSGGGRVRR